MVIRPLILYFTLLFLKGQSQKYNFVNWTVEDGLIQSQASIICQDQHRQLWIGTEGGVSRFDGKKFSGLTIHDGLITNRIISLYSDKRQHMWVGTNNGLCVYDGIKFTPVPTGTAVINNIFAVTGSDSLVFALSNFELYLIRDLKAQRISVSGDSIEKVTALYRSSQGTLVYVHQKGLYLSEGNKWRKLYLQPTNLSGIQVLKIFVTSAKDTLLLSNRGLKHLRFGKIIAFSPEGIDLSELNVICMAEDSKQNLWLGCDNGAYKLDGKTLKHFDERSGFTDNSVNSIFPDSENNLWFGTNGDGIFKFRENTFTYYDRSTGLHSAIVMGVAQTSDNFIYTGGYGGGLFHIVPKGVEQLSHHGLVLPDAKINCLYADKNNTLLIGTLYKGIWTYDKTQGVKPMLIPGHPDFMINGVTCFLRDHLDRLFIGSQSGLFYIHKDSVVRVQINSRLITAVREFDREHILVGTSKGLFLIDNNNNVTPFMAQELGDASVLCVAKNQDNLWIGTTDKGVLNIHLRTGKILTYNTTQGLPSNFIYSMDVSEKNRAWIGTGFGISNLRLDGAGNVLAIKNYGRSDGLLGMECNHNSILRASDSSLWFGTTKGLFHFDPHTEISEKNRPYVMLRSVELFSSAIKDSTYYSSIEPWFRIPMGLKLPAGQNHLSFELGAIYFTNPDDILFKYKLEGIDKDFTSSLNPFITYPGLPPGKYTLKVLGVTKSGVLSSNMVGYSFEIEKAFYQTRIFQALVIFLLISTGAALAYFVTRARHRRRQREKEIMEKIREEEFVKLRQRTAEDFHDEMGNSLTRISVLTDVLKSKLNGTENEVSKLVQQIKENTTALYSGSRDIIWSLNSQNDGIYEIAEHVKDIGNEAFQDTNLDFRFTHNIILARGLKLKLDYSRNLTMIFKEAYSNILKHSGASKVQIMMDAGPSDELEIFIRDNGKGFNPADNLNGNGIRNMHSRTTRMKGAMDVNSFPEKGTELHFIFKDLFIETHGKQGSYKGSNNRR
jgi:ligand-binding sensor domain-containing protein/signal transduction histidine kinase